MQVAVDQYSLNSSHQTENSIFKNFFFLFVRFWILNECYKNVRLKPLDLYMYTSYGSKQFKAQFTWKFIFSIKS